MLRIIGKDGEVFEGRTATAIVHQMNMEGWVIDTSVRPGTFLMRLLKEGQIFLPADEQGSLFSAEERFAEAMKQDAVPHFD